jgi:hypothetical protein
MGKTVLKQVNHEQGAIRLARCLRQIVLDNIGSEAVPDWQLLWEGKFDGKAKRTWYSGY